MAKKSQKCIGERMMEAMPMRPPVIMVVKKAVPKKRRSSNAKG